MVVLRTLGAPQRRLLGGRKQRSVDSASEPEPVPTSRATIVQAEAVSDPDAWLDRDHAPLVADAEGELNFVLRAHRAAAADPYVREVTSSHALVVRVGYGAGEEVAEGRFTKAVELPKGPPKRKRGEALAPQERLAAVLGGRDSLLVGEELVLRARLDLDAGRPREAALQARIALEALLAELDEKFSADLRQLRDPLARTANYALEGDLSGEDAAAVEEAVAAMERAARRRSTAGGA